MIFTKLIWKILVSKFYIKPQLKVCKSCIHTIPCRSGKKKVLESELFSIVFQKRYCPFKLILRIKILLPPVSPVINSKYKQLFCMFRTINRVSLRNLLNFEEFKFLYKIIIASVFKVKTCSDKPINSKLLKMEIKRFNFIFQFLNYLHS